MPLGGTFLRVAELGQAWPDTARIASGLALVGLAWGSRELLEIGFPATFFPWLFSYPAVLGASVFGGMRAGMVATAAACAVGALGYAPIGSLSVEAPENMLSIVLFALNGALIAATIETLRHALERSQAGEAALRISETGRRVVLEEYRHRMRNDLQSMVGLLLLRGRAARAEETKAELREAASHMLGLARIHRRMEGVQPGAAGPVLPTQAFVADLCAEIEAANGAGSRPVALVALAEEHTIETERAVQIGLIITETVGNAYRFAFPGDSGGTICVRFWRDGASYVLTVDDDGAGIPPGAGLGLGYRILRAFGAQLRGVLHRHPGPRGLGTSVECRFPFYAAGVPIGRGAAASAGPVCGLATCHADGSPPPCV